MRWRWALFALIMLAACGPLPEATSVRAPDARHCILDGHVIARIDRDGMNWRLASWSPCVRAGNRIWTSASDACEQLIDECRVIE